MSLKRTRSMPSQQEINNLVANMTMNEIRATQTFENMPTRYHIHNRVIPKSALRRDDLARYYLLYGGTLVKHTPKPLKHFRPSRKKTTTEKKKDRHELLRTKDHKGTLQKARHATKSLVRKPVKEPSLPTFHFEAGAETLHVTSDSDDEIINDMVTLSLQSDAKRQRFPRLAESVQQTNNDVDDSDSDQDNVDDDF